MQTQFSSQSSSPSKVLDLDSITFCHERNSIYTDHKEIYQNIRIVKLLARSEFPVYLVNSQVTKLNYAMKVFEHESGKPHFYFNNESRFVGLRHPNVIRGLYCENEREIKINGITKKVSYIIMEHAQYGDLMSFLKENPRVMDEKLARTYFRQLIEGLEYVHRNEIAHMDLKLDNLLITNDYCLKIADFDTAHYKEDPLVISNGTKYCRAPEVYLGRCKDSKAADVYSAGLILFVLKTKGKFPQFENESIYRINLADLLHNNVSQFWKSQTEILNLSEYFFDSDFKDLFIKMTRFDPESRATIKEIKASKWFNGPCYSAEELKAKMKCAF